MKLIILVTDGCSNVGVSPVIGAAHAYAEGIVVNVIGVVDEGEIGKRGAEEIAEIAQAGGGLSRIVHSRDLTKTVQMLTQQAVQLTIRQTVQEELRQLVGSTGIEDLSPVKRSVIVQAMDDWTEMADLQVALLIDASASMKSKLRAVEHAVRDLMLSLQARAGKSEICVFHFPGMTSDEMVKQDLPWTNQLAKIPHLFYKINMKGTTPTGPALLETVSYMLQLDKGSADDERMSSKPKPSGAYVSKEGILSDYIV